MPFSQTNIGTATGASGATLAITIPAGGVPAGSLIVVAVTEKSTSGTSGTLADTATNTWNTSQAGNLAGLAANGRGTIFFAFNSKALVSGNSITYTRNLSAASTAMSACYFTGVKTGANPEDTAARATANGTTGTITVTSGTPANAGDLFVGVLCDSGTSVAGGNATFTQAANWATPPNEATTGGSAGSRVNGGQRFGSGTSTVTYNPTLSSTAQQWILFVTAFIMQPDALQFFPDRRGIPTDGPELWTGRPIDSAPIQLSTAQRMFGGGGQVTAHRYNDDPTFQTDLWLGQPSGVNRSLQSPQATVVRAPFYAPHPERVGDPIWLGAPIATSSLNLPSTLFARATLFVPGEKPQEKWQGAPQISYTLNLPTIKQPPTKQWRYDHVEMPSWLGGPIASKISIVSPPPFNKSIRYDLTPDPDWIGRAIKSAIISLQGVQAPTKTWRYDYDQTTLWQAQPIATGILTFPTAAKPVAKFWRQDLAPDTHWAWQVPPSLAAFYLQLYAVTPQWETWDQQFETLWIGRPLSSAISTIPVVTAVQLPRAPFYAARATVDTAWTWQPAANLSVRIPTLVLPFAKLWKPDHDRFEPIWLWQAPPSLTPRIPAPAPFFKLWRSDLITDTAWTWQAPPSLAMRLPPLPPFHRLWRYDLITDTEWLGRSTRAATLQLGRPAIPPQWTNLYQPEPGWTWQSPPPWAMRIPPQQTIYGRPGQGPTKGWHYDYDMIGSFWSWQIPISLTLYIPAAVPTVVAMVGPMIGAYPKWRMLGGVASAPDQPGFYVAEDGATFYVTEDGQTFYVKEN